jgi:hypothetical protein
MVENKLNDICALPGQKTVNKERSGKVAQRIAPSRQKVALPARQIFRISDA